MVLHIIILNKITFMAYKHLWKSRWKGVGASSSRNLGGKGGLYLRKTCLTKRENKVWCNSESTPLLPMWHGFDKHQYDNNFMHLLWNIYLWILEFSTLYFWNPIWSEECTHLTLVLWNRTHSLSPISTKTRRPIIIEYNYVNTKGNTFSSVILRPQVLVQPWFQHALPIEPCKKSTIEGMSVYGRFDCILTGEIKLSRHKTSLDFFKVKHASSHLLLHHNSLTPQNFRQPLNADFSHVDFDSNPTKTIN